MTAPGQNLEFSGAPDFQKRVAFVPGLREAVQRHIEAEPAFGIERGAGVRTGMLVFGGAEYGVAFVRRGQKVGLLAVYALPEDRGQFEARTKKLIELFDHS